MRLINADAFLEEARNKLDMQDVYLPIHIKELVIDEMPTIDAEPIRHGKWLMSDVYGAYCSECGDAAFEITGSQYSKMKTRYCWQCGAKMDADEISNIAKESADKISKALEKVRAKGMQKQNIEEDDKP